MSISVAGGGIAAGGMAFDPKAAFIASVLLEIPPAPLLVISSGEDADMDDGRPSALTESDADCKGNEGLGLTGPFVQ
jgi:hypothetical protein